MPEVVVDEISKLEKTCSVTKQDGDEGLYYDVLLTKIDIKK